MENSDAARIMIDYLKQQRIVRGDVELHEDTELVSSGLVDSFALVDVLLKLEEVTGRHIPAGRVFPPDMDTVRKMLLLAEQVGKPRT